LFGLIVDGEIETVETEGVAYVNVAVHVLLPFIVTCPLELQSPLQPEKTDPAEAVAPAVAVTP